MTKTKVLLHRQGQALQSKGFIENPNILNQKMQEYHLLEWTFSPSNFFEQDLEFTIYDITITITPGKVSSSKINPEIFSRDLVLDAHKKLRKIFMFKSALNQSSFDLSRPTESKILPSGKRMVNMGSFLKPSVMRSRASVSGVIIKKADGTIIDTKKESLAAEKEFIENSSQLDDNCLTLMLCSYNQAMKDKDNYLIHLYEIRDALSEKFNGKKNAIKELCLSEPSKDIKLIWDELGRMANDEPRAEGRHRGKSLAIIASTPEERSRCEDIAIQLISAYIKYLVGRA
jgi:hypothetical protein